MLSLFHQTQAGRENAGGFSYAAKLNAWVMPNQSVLFRVYICWIWDPDFTMRLVDAKGIPPPQVWQTGNCAVHAQYCTVPLQSLIIDNRPKRPPRHGDVHGTRDLISLHSWAPHASYENTCAAGHHARVLAVDNNMVNEPLLTTNVQQYILCTNSIILITLLSHIIRTYIYTYTCRYVAY